MSKLEELSVRELCDRRDAIEAELERRAAESLPLRSRIQFSRSAERSVTLRSTDGSAILVRFYSDTPPSAVERSRISERFPNRHRWDCHAFDANALWGELLVVPLNVYEQGAAAIAAYRNEEDQRRADEGREAERRYYEELKAKFEDASA
jgi:hypothetical protein